VNVNFHGGLFPKVGEGGEIQTKQTPCIPIGPISIMALFERSDSFDSIPDVGHILESFDPVEAHAVLAPVDMPSEFKLLESAGKLQPEPLLAEDKTRFVLFPIKHSDVSDARDGPNATRTTFCVQIFFHS